MLTERIVTRCHILATHSSTVKSTTSRPLRHGETLGVEVASPRMSENDGRHPVLLGGMLRKVESATHNRPAATDDRAPPNRLRMATYRTESEPGDFGN